LWWRFFSLKETSDPLVPVVENPEGFISVRISSNTLWLSFLLFPILEPLPLPLAYCPLTIAIDH
jgi:hypothetical protein